MTGPDDTSPDAGPDTSPDISPDISAADRYKERIAAIADQLSAGVERNSDRIERLRAEAPELGEALTKAADDRVLVRIAANLAWEDALELLWTETKVEMKPFPRPNQFVKQGRFVKEVDVRAGAAEIERCSEALHEAVVGRKRG